MALKGKNDGYQNTPERNKPDKELPEIHIKSSKMTDTQTEIAFYLYR